MTIPAIAAAALSKIGREMPLRPRMSTTECITQTSLSPTKSPKRRRPEAQRRDEQLRHADGERLHRGRAQQRALGAAEAEHAVHAAVGEQAHDDLAHALAHQRHGRAARAGGADVGELVPARRAATSWRLTSAAIAGSPRMPESITTAPTPSASSRSRT